MWNWLTVCKSQESTDFVYKKNSAGFTNVGDLFDFPPFLLLSVGIPQNIAVMSVHYPFILDCSAVIDSYARQI